MAKVLITEQLHPAGPELLRAQGHQVVFFENLGGKTLGEALADADAVLVRISELRGGLLKDAKHLKVISKHGVGVDNIDLDYCRGAGIAVTIAPNGNSLSVAEHALTMMLALSKKLIPITNAYREIGFSAKNTMEGVEFTGKTVGIIGLGRIGRHLARMVTHAFGARVIAYDPYLTQAPEGVELTGDLDRVFREANFVSLHAGLTPETRHMADRRRLAMMKPGAVLINCARGGLVDEAALVEALEAGRLGGAGLDVTEPEPARPDHPLFRMPNVILTPHFAPDTTEAAVRVSTMAAQNIIDVLGGKRPEGQIV